MKRIILSLAALALAASAPAQDNTRSYILKKTYTATGQGASYTDITYYDGLGFPSQVINVGASTSGGNVVTPVWYDAQRRDDARVYLPYASASTTAAYEANAFAKQQSFYTSKYSSAESARAFTENIYEPSPVGRVVESYKPGKDYQPLGKKATVAYAANAASEVRKFASTTGASVTVSYHAAGTLYKTTSTNEDGQKVETFTDAFGRTMLERAYDGSTKLDTYYAYDNCGRLSWVLPPEASRLLTATSGTIAESNTTVAELCYISKYDERGRLAYNKLPGRSAESYTYDNVDRMTARTSGDEVFTYAYDNFDRVLTEKYKKGTTEVLSAEYTYDATPIALTAVSGVILSTDVSASRKGYKTSENVLILDGNELTASRKYVARTFSYDRRGRLIQTIETNHLSGKSMYSTKYNFSGTVDKSHESHQKASGATADILLKTYAYDGRDRMKSETSQLNSGTAATVTLTYNDLGQSASKTYGTGTYAVDETFRYNIQGWLTEQNSTKFNLKLKYYDAAKVTAGKRWAGDISEVEWQHLAASPAQSVNTYCFTYDGLSRLTDTKQYIGSTLNNQYVEQGITYDQNGNIKTLKRYNAGSLADNFTYTYTGNKLSNINSTYNYAYDTKGNCTTDGLNALNLGYNCLNLIREVKVGSTVKAQYTGLSDGSKSGVKDGAGTGGYEYLGSLVYQRQSGALSLESAGFSGGRIQMTSGSQEVLYYLTDHLGSTRVIVNASGTEKARYDYQPFGQSRNVNLASTNRYQFNGKESQTDLGVNYLDYGARMYDNRVGRWHSVDPLAEERHGITPFNFCSNAPISRIDPDGMLDRGIGIYTRYEDERGNLIVDTDDGSNAVIVVPDSKLPAFTWALNHTSEDNLNSQEWNYAWKSYLTGIEWTDEHELVVNHLHSDGARKAAVRYWQTGSMKDFSRLMFAELGGQWTTPELAIGGLSAGLLGAQALGNSAQGAKSVIRGFTKHGANQAAARGFKASDIQRIVQRGTPTQAVGRYGPQTRYTIGGNTVVLNSQGKVVTVFSNAPGTANGFSRGNFKP